MTFEEWVNATSKGTLHQDDERPSLCEAAYDALGGDVDEEEVQKLETPNPRAEPPLLHPRSLVKKPLGQPSLSK